MKNQIGHLLREAADEADRNRVALRRIQELMSGNAWSADPPAKDRGHRATFAPGALLAPDSGDWHRGVLREAPRAVSVESGRAHFGRTD